MTDAATTDGAEPGTPATDGGAPRRGLRLDVLWVGAGIGVYGLSSFAFLAVAAQQMGQSPGYTALGLLFTLLNALGIGLYLPVEQETGRTVSAQLSLGRPTAPGAATPLRYAGASLAVIALVGVVLRTQVADLFFEGHDGVTVMFVLALGGMAVAYLVRGVLAGTRRFPRYGIQLALDGALRVGGAGALALAGDVDPVHYGAVLAVAPVLSSAVAVLRSGPLLTRPPAGTPRTPVVLAPLVLASVASQALANAGPVAAQLLRTPAEETAAGNLVTALTIARIPLFLFAAVQAVFLPTLAQHVALGARDRFVRALRTATWATAAIAVLGVVATWAVGPQAVRLVFGPTFEIGRGDITLLAVSAALFMVVQVLVQGLLAHSQDAQATVAWIAGLVCLVGALLVPLTLTTRVSLALVVGSAGALVLAAVAVRRTLTAWTPEVDHEHA